MEVDPPKTRSERIYKLCQEHLPNQPLRRKGVTLDGLVTLLREKGVFVNSDGTLAPEGVYKVPRKRYKFDSFTTGCPDVDFEIFLKIKDLISIRAASLVNRSVYELLTSPQSEHFYRRLLERFLEEKLEGGSNYRGAWRTFSLGSALREPQPYYTSLASCCVYKFILGKKALLSTLYKKGNLKLAKVAPLDLGEVTLSLIKVEIEEFDEDDHLIVYLTSFYAALGSGRIDSFLWLFEKVCDLRDAHKACRAIHDPSTDNYYYLWDLDMEVLRQGTPEKIKAFAHYALERYGEAFREVLGYKKRLEAIADRKDPEIYLAVLPLLRDYPQKKLLEKLTGGPSEVHIGVLKRLGRLDNNQRLSKKLIDQALEGGSSVEILHALASLGDLQVDKAIRKWFEGSSRFLGCCQAQKIYVAETYPGLSNLIETRTPLEIKIRHYGETWGGTKIYQEKALEALHFLISMESSESKGRIQVSDKVLPIAQEWIYYMDLSKVPLEEAEKLMETFLGPRKVKSLQNTLGFLELFFWSERPLKVSKESITRIVNLLRRYPLETLGERGISRLKSFENLLEN